MTAGNNGASTPEDDDPFGYLYADGQASGATPPGGGGGGYGYPGPRSYNQVRTVGERQYGQQQYGQQAQTAAYGQVPQQQGRPNPHYQAPETLPGGAPRQSPPPSGGRGRGPNTKGLLIGAIAVVAAVVIGIGVAILSGGTDDNKGKNEAGSSPSASAPDGQPTDKATDSTQAPGELPKADAKALKLNLATVASDVRGAKSAGGVYVGNFNQVGASATWTVSVPKGGKYTLDVNYGVPGKKADATLTVNGTAQSRTLNLDNFAKAPEGDWEKGWTNTWANLVLTKGTNQLKISCEQGNQCEFNLDQVSLVEGWKD